MEKNLYLLRTARIFGIFPFEILDSNIQTSVKLKIINLVIIIFLIVGALITGGYYNRPLGLVGRIIDAIFGFSAAMGAAVMLTNSAAISGTFHKIKFVSENLIQHMEYIPYKRSNTALILLIFEFCSEIYFMLSMIYIANPNRLWNYGVDISYIVIRLYNVLLDIIAILFISGTNNLFKLINEKLKLIRRHFFQNMQIVNLQILHADAGDLFNEVHKCFQLYFLATMWSHASSLSYVIFQYLNDENFKIWEEVYWVSYILAQIMALVVVCSETVNEVIIVN